MSVLSRHWPPRHPHSILPAAAVTPPSPPSRPPRGALKTGQSSGSLGSGTHADTIRANVATCDAQHATHSNKGATNISMSMSLASRDAWLVGSTVRASSGPDPVRSTSKAHSAVGWRDGRLMRSRPWRRAAPSSSSSGQERRVQQRRRRLGRHPAKAALGVLYLQYKCFPSLALQRGSSPQEQHAGSLGRHTGPAVA